MKKEKTEVSSQKSGVGEQTKPSARRVREYLRLLLSVVVLTAIVFSGSVTQLNAQQQPAEGAKSSAGKQAAAETVDLQSVVASQAALVTEFEVNGLKVIMKRREGSLTVAAGLFLRGGVRNINAENAGIESLMLAAATEATTNFPRESMRSELSRMGTVIGDGINYDY